MARGHNFELTVEKIISRGVLLVEAHVARRFLQRRDADARVFEQFGSDVGNIFAGKMRAAQLGNRIVAIADQHAFIKRPCLLQGRAVVGCRVFPAEQVFQAKLRIAEEFVQERSAQTFRRAAIAGEERSGDFLRQLEAEYRAIEIGKKRTETILLFDSKLSGHSYIVLDVNWRHFIQFWRNDNL